MPENLQELLGGVTPEMMEQVQRMAQSMFGGESTEEQSRTETVPETAPGFSIDPAMLMKLQSLLNRPPAQDSRANLIEAIKPHLSEARRRKADEALGILRAFEILPLLQSTKDAM